MLRGCQKKIVFLKNTGSKIFDEAYFVISGRDDAPIMSDEGRINEAKRIVSEATFDGVPHRGRGAFRSRISKFALPFLLGAVISGFLTSLIFLLAS